MNTAIAVLDLLLFKDLKWIDYQTFSKVNLRMKEIYNLLHQ